MTSLLLGILLGLAPAPPASPPGNEPVQEETVSPIEKATALLPAGFNEHETRHWVILSDARWDTIEHVGRHLEATLHQFSRVCRLLGATRPMPTERMLCIVFSEAEAFKDFAGAGDGLQIDPEHVGGYFSPSAEWILFYEPRGLPGLESARRELDEDEASPPDDEEQAREHERRINEHRDALDDLEIGLRTSLAVHEATHQLAWITEFTDHRGGWNLWLHEGFATCFETHDTSRAFGPTHESPFRRDQFVNAMNESTLVPLEELLVIRDFDGIAPERLNVIYAQSYALVRWLWRFRRTQLNGYIRSLRENPDYVFPRDQLKAFEDAFGPIDRLERRWLRDEEDAWWDRG